MASIPKIKGIRAAMLGTSEVQVPPKVSWRVRVVTPVHVAEALEIQPDVRRRRVVLLAPVRERSRPYAVYLQTEVSLKT